MLYSRPPLVYTVPKVARWAALLAAVAILLYAAGGWAAPELSVQALTGPARPGTPFVVGVTLSWDGAPDAYTVLPLETPELDWGAAALTAMRAETHEGRPVVYQALEIVAEERGDFTLPAMTVGYRAGGVAASMRTEPLTIAVRPDRRAWWAAGAGAAAVAVLAGLGLWRWRARRRVDAGRVPDPAARAREALHDARRKRLDGDFYGFYKALLRAAECFARDESARRLQVDLAQRAQEAGYRGVRPNDDAMDSDMRAVERALTRSQEEDGR